MGRPRTGIIRTALWRLAGLVATLTVAALLLGLLLGDGAPISAFISTLSLDFGTSASMNASVGELIAERLAVTLPLAAFAAVLAVAIGFPLGFAARDGRTARATVLVTGARLLLALPPFWLGMVLVVTFTGALKWVNAGGFVPWEQNIGGALASLTLPCVALALPFAAILARAAARSTADIEVSPVVVGARLNGLTAREAILCHGLVPALVSLFGLVGTRFGLLVSGSLVVENVFYLPGLGRLLFAGAAEGDAALVRGTLFVLIAVAALVRMLTELVALLASPQRINGLPA